jgi:arylsulfatase A-like enzyme
MSVIDKNVNTPVAFFLLATGTALLLLAIEWMLVSSFGFGLEQGEIARTLAGLLILGLVVGIAACCCALMLSQYGAIAALATALAIMLFMEMYAAMGNHSLAKLLGSGAGAIVAFLAIIRLTGKMPEWLLRPANGLALGSALFALLLLQTASSAVDNAGVGLAAATAIAAGILLFLWWRGRSGRFLEPVLILAMVLVVSVYLGNRVPVRQPDNSFATGKPSVLLVTIDTLRADHVGAYGYARANTPTLDGLAKEGVLFNQAVTAHVYTGPSHTSILTGLLPKHHGVLVNNVPLQDGIPTLADMLRAEGYVTAAFVSTHILSDRDSGLPSRFHAFNDDSEQFKWFPSEISGVAGLHLMNQYVKKLLNYRRGSSYPWYRMGADTTDIAIEWLEHNAGRPLFTWVHLYDPHLPHQQHDGHSEGTQGVPWDWYNLNASERSKIVNSPELMAAMISQYDDEISYADAQLARIVDAARQATSDGRLLVIVTSDHGQMISEHETYWTRRLYDPTLLVPLIIVPPERMDGMLSEVDTQASLVDLAPTILELLEVDYDQGFDGISMVNIMSGTGVDNPRPAFSSIHPHDSDYDRERHSVREQGWKLIRNYAGWDSTDKAHLAGEVDEELYHLEQDPGEIANLVESVSNMKQQLGVRLDKLDPEVGKQQELHLTPEDRERLRSLGYIQ